MRVTPYALKGLYGNLTLNYPFSPFLSGALRKPRRLIRMKHFACIRKRVLLFVNTGDTQEIIPISLTVLMCLRQYLIELHREKQST